MLKEELHWYMTWEHRNFINCLKWYTYAPHLCLRLEATLAATVKADNISGSDALICILLKKKWLDKLAVFLHHPSYCTSGVRLAAASEQTTLRWPWLSEAPVILNNTDETKVRCRECGVTYFTFRLLGNYLNWPIFLIQEKWVRFMLHLSGHSLNRIE